MGGTLYNRIDDASNRADALGADMQVNEEFVGFIQTNGNVVFGKILDCLLPILRVIQLKK